MRKSRLRLNYLLKVTELLSMRNSNSGILTPSHICCCCYCYVFMVPCYFLFLFSSLSKNTYFFICRGLLFHVEYACKILDLWKSAEIIKHLSFIGAFGTQCGGNMVNDQGKQKKTYTMPLVIETHFSNNVPCYLYACYPTHTGIVFSSVSTNGNLVFFQG